MYYSMTYSKCVPIYVFITLFVFLEVCKSINIINIMFDVIGN